MSEPNTTPEPGVLPPKQSTTLARRVLINGSSVAIPDGFRLAKGACKLGDMHLKHSLFIKTGAVEWIPVESRFCGQDEGGIYCGSDWYALLIRPTPTEPPAERTPVAAIPPVPANLSNWPVIPGYQCRNCGDHARRNPANVREWGCASCGGSSYSVALKFEPTASEPRKEGHSALRIKDGSLKTFDPHPTAPTATPDKTPLAAAWDQAGRVQREAAERRAAEVCEPDKTPGQVCFIGYEVAAGSTAEHAAACWPDTPADEQLQWEAAAAAVTEQLRAENERLRIENDLLRRGAPLGPIIGASTIVEQELELKQLRTELAAARNLLSLCCDAPSKLEICQQELAAATQAKVEAERERDEARINCNAVLDGLEWMGDGYSWNPKDGDYRERVVDALRRGAEAIEKRLAQTEEKRRMNWERARAAEQHNAALVAALERVAERLKQDANRLELECDDPPSQSQQLRLDAINAAIQAARATLAGVPQSRKDEA